MIGKIKWYIEEYIKFRLYKIKNMGYSHRTFWCGNVEYPYFISFTNLAYTSERTMEIPIINTLIGTYQPKNILEIGNVLNNYFKDLKIPHVVVDKYEKGKNVYNIDFVEYNGDKKFDMIVSISTLEHIGWDSPEVRDEQKTLRAFSKMKSLLNPNGKLFITIPLGHNAFLDNFLKTGQIKTDRMYLMKRISKRNDWREQPLSLLQTTERFPNMYPYKYGNWVLIMIYENKP